MTRPWLARAALPLFLLELGFQLLDAFPSLAQQDLHPDEVLVVLAGSELELEANAAGRLEEGLMSSGR